MATSRTWPGYIADGDIAAGKAVTTGLMTDIRNSLSNMADRIGVPATYSENVEDHDHDAVNSAQVDANNLLNKDGILSTYLAQKTALINNVVWTFSTGALGFEPIMMIVHWICETNTIDAIQGWGMATAAAEEQGMSHTIDDATITIDANDIMGFDTGGGLQTGFNERAAVTAWGAANITITTQTGAWSANADTLYANLLVLGA